MSPLLDPLKRLLGGSLRRVPIERVDLNALYFVRVPNGDYVPGRVIETHRLWECHWNEPLPYVSADRTPLPLGKTHCRLPGDRRPHRGRRRPRSS